jgi:hypothetical protein
VTITCREFRERALELGDARVPLETELREHLDSCDACRAVAGELEAVTEAARRLGPRPLPADAWPRLALELGRRGVSAPAAQAPLRWTGTWLAVAASLLVTLGAALWVVARGPAIPASGNAAATGASAPTSSELVATIESELQLAASHYEKAIAGLEQVATASDAPLDPAVMATLRQNLKVIDAAIDDSRVALRSEPGNTVAQESLFEAFRRKIALLQDTIALMNEMRKGDEMGAARAVESLNKS